MSFVSSEVLSLNHKGPVGGYLMVWNFSFRSLGIATRYRNVFTVFVLNIDHYFVSINANIHGFGIFYSNYPSFSVRAILLALP